MAIKVWRVQWASGAAVSCPTIHTDAEMAKQQVAALIEGFLLKSIEASLIMNKELEQNLDYVNDGAITADSIVTLMGQGDIWDAYDHWHDFLDRWDEKARWTYPMWVKIGTVIVDTRELDGPRQRKKTLPMQEHPPIMDYDLGEGFIMGPGEKTAEAAEILKQALKKKKGQEGGPSMGVGPAAPRWLVSKLSFRDPRHSSYHLLHEDAVAHAVYILAELTEDAIRYSEYLFQVDPTRAARIVQGVNLVRTAYITGSPEVAIVEWRNLEEDMEDDPLFFDTVGSLRIEPV